MFKVTELSYDWQKISLSEALTGFEIPMRMPDGRTLLIKSPSRKIYSHKDKQVLLISNPTINVFPLIYCWLLLCLSHLERRVLHELDELLPLIHTGDSRRRSC